VGRKQQTQPPIPATTIREAFHVRQDGQIVRRSTGEIATFSGPGAQLLVRVYQQGSIRRFAAGRVAWAIAVGEWPKGVVKARNGVDDDLRPENLIVVKAGARPFDQGKGGMASSLERRAQTTTTLINALADHPGATVPMLSKLVGFSAPCVCTRLGKLADMGLTCGPKCDARARWDLTAQGRAIAASALPLIDDLDKDILTRCARAAHGLMALARVTGSCRLTMRRRVDALIARALVSQTDGRYAITDQGRAALGDQCPKPWVRPELVSAAAARDVLARGGSDLLTTAERGRMGGLAAARGNRAMPSVELDRIAS
jgi:HNH endonuclease